jgi:ABC-type sugar transport system substrate-binding protein
MVAAAVIGVIAAVPAARAEDKLIVGAMSFPCGLNDFAKTMCEGFAAGAAELPRGYRFELKTGVDYGDQTAFNNIIETSLQLHPAGIIVFPVGPAAQVPVLKKACEQGTKIIIVDNPVEGLGECQTSYIASDHYRLGVALGNWLVSHAPSSKEVGVVSLPPGQYSSNDARIKGFTDTIEPAGFKVVATVTTDLSLDQTRTQVTNMLTAHPDLGAVMSANDQMGYGTAQAVGDRKVVQLSIDGAMDAVKRIDKGGLDADAAQDPYTVAKSAVLNIAKAIDGGDVPKEITTKSIVVDRSNAQAFIAGGGMHRIVAN